MHAVFFLYFMHITRKYNTYISVLKILGGHGSPRLFNAPPQGTPLGHFSETQVVGSSGLEIIKKRGVKLIINVS